MTAPFPPQRTREAILRDIIPASADLAAETARAIEWAEAADTLAGEADLVAWCVAERDAAIAKATELTDSINALTAEYQLVTQRANAGQN